MKLLIVEDEQNTADGLAQFLSREVAELQEIHIARDATEGYEKFLALRPDILISDIVMPNGSGIDLLRRCLKRTKDFKPIIISGYSEVDYLRNAIQLQAVDYLFKPIDVDELLQVVRKSMQMLADERERSEETKRLYACLQDYMPLIRQRYLENLLAIGIRPGPELDERISTLGLPEWLSEGGIVVCVLLGACRAADARARMLRDMATAGLERVLSACLAEADAQVLSSEQATAQCICRPDCPKELLYAACSRVNAELQKQFGIQAAFGISGAFASPSAFPVACRQAQDAAQQRFLLGNDIVFYEDLHWEQSRLCEIPSGLEQALIDCVMGADDARIPQTVSSLFDNWKTAACLSEDDMQDIRLSLIEMFVRIVSHMRLVIGKEQMNVNNLGWDELLSLPTLEDIEKWLSDKLTLIWLYIHERTRKNNKRLVQKAQWLMNEKFATLQGVQGIADELQVSPNYLGSLFKQETGTSLIESLTDIRMRKAKELLSDPGLFIQEIGERVGVSDSNYFAKLFRNKYGMSASEYRRTLE